MSLVRTSLKSDIQRIFDKKLQNTSQIAAEIAEAYARYAKSAMAPRGEPVVLNGMESVHIRQSIDTIFRSKSPAPTAAAMIGSAVQRFWTLPPVATSGGGLATIAIIAAGVAKMSITRANTYSEAADSLASALDIITKTVIISYTTPGPNLLPLK